MTSITQKKSLDLKLHWMAQQHIVDNFTTPHTPRHLESSTHKVTACRNLWWHWKLCKQTTRCCLCFYETVTGHWRLCAYVWQNQYCFLSGSKWECKVKDYHSSKFSDGDQRERQRWHVVMWCPQFCVTCSIWSTNRESVVNVVAQIITASVFGLFGTGFVIWG